MPLENRTFSLLDEQATKRGVSVQELLRAVIVPEWLRMRSHVVNGEAAPPYRRTLAYKLSSLEKAFQDLKSEVERGALADQGEGTLVRPVKLIRSVDALLIRTFGRIVASNLLYEIGKEAGRHSVTSVDKGDQ